MRVTNAVLSFVLAVALAAAGIVVAVEIALAGLDDSYWVLPWPDWYRWLLDHNWTDTVVAVTCWGLCVAGAILLFFALAIYRPLRLDAKPYNPDVNSTVRRSSLERSLQRTAQTIDGIVGVGVKVSRHTVRIKARSNRRDIAGLRDDVARSVSGQLETLHLVNPPQVRVQVAPRGR
jgi:hypothetical protein